MNQSLSPEISIITVNYGNSEKIKNLWESLQKFPPSKTWEWIIVDNHSQKGDAEKLDELDEEKHIHVVKLSQNLGFGRGNEEGVKFAHGKYLAFVNPDIELEQGCLDHLVQALEENPKRGIVCPFLETKDGVPLENARDFPTPLELLGRRIFQKKSAPTDTNKSPVAVDWAQASFLVMQKEFFTQTLQGFDPRFFLFFEDTDLCRRVWDGGKEVVQVKSAKAFHGRDRLSGTDIITSLWRKTFWIHLVSAMKYFWKYKGKETRYKKQ